MTRSYYEVLLVPRTANDEEIKRAYRKLAMQYHPDRNPGREKWATDKFKEINEAFSVLGEPEKRRRYDQLGDGGNISDILRSPVTRTTFKDLENNYGESGLGFDFLDVILGDYLKEAESTCKTSDRGSQCSGGIEPKTPAGINSESMFGQARPLRQDVQYEITISREDAAQGLEKELVSNGKRLMVRIPAGVRDGSKVRLHNGRQIADGKPGDIIILVRVP